jgi:hypothetical protein
VKLSALHYGYALEPAAARKKHNPATLYSAEDAVRRNTARPPRYYDDDQKVKPKGTHPVVMRDIVAARDWTYHSAIR